MGSFCSCGIFGKKVQNETQPDPKRTRSRSHISDVNDRPLTLQSNTSVPDYDTSPAVEDIAESQLSLPIKSQPTPNRVHSASLSSPEPPPLDRPPSVYFTRQKSQRDLFRPELTHIMEDLPDMIADGLGSRQMTLKLGVNERDPEFAQLQQEIHSLSKETDIGMNPSNNFWALTRSQSQISRSESDSKEKDNAQYIAAPDCPEWVILEQYDNDIDADDGHIDEGDDIITLEPDAIKPLNELPDALIAIRQELRTLYVTNDVGDESASEHCCDAPNGKQHTFAAIREHCPCFQRISVVMKAYHAVLDDESLWHSTTLQRVIQSDDYGHQQIADDFIHCFAVHIDADDARIRRQEHAGNMTSGLSIGQQMARHFIRCFPCGLGPRGMKQCRAFLRHFRPRQPSPIDVAGVRNRTRKTRIELRRLYQTTEAKDIVFQEECDKIHSYFMQFGVHYKGKREMFKPLLSCLRRHDLDGQVSEMVL